LQHFVDAVPITFKLLLARLKIDARVDIHDHSAAAAAAAAAAVGQLGIGRNGEPARRERDG